jgi:GTP-binding protein
MRRWVESGEGLETSLRIDTVQFVLSAFSDRDFPRDGKPEVVFVGRSNVGKSSLLNALLGRKALARVSSTPGRTRAVNYFLVNRRFYFVDLPGYGWAKAGQRERQRWADLAEAYFRHSAARALVIQLVDAKVGATDLDRQAWDYLTGFGIPVTPVATKIDRVPRGRRRRQLEAVRDKLDLQPRQPIIALSSRTGEGMKELWKELDACLLATA